MCACMYVSTCACVYVSTRVCEYMCVSVCMYVYVDMSPFEKHRGGELGSHSATLPYFLETRSSLNLELGRWPASCFLFPTSVPQLSDCNPVDSHAWVSFHVVSGDLNPGPHPCSSLLLLLLILSARLTLLKDQKENKNKQN